MSLRQYFLHLLSQLSLMLRALPAPSPFQSRGKLIKPANLEALLFQESLHKAQCLKGGNICSYEWINGWISDTSWSRWEGLATRWSLAEGSLPEVTQSTLKSPHHSAYSQGQLWRKVSLYSTQRRAWDSNDLSCLQNWLLGFVLNHHLSPVPSSLASVEKHFSLRLRRLLWTHGPWLSFHRHTSAV